VELHRGVDDDKDQTYFLWALPRRVLPYLLFPLGDMTKAEVRAQAVARGLSVAWKPSSNGLCFVAGTVREHLAERLDERPGPVVDVSQGGAVVGEHRGVAFYTIGQKRGLGLWKSHLPRWVIELDAESNTVVVGSPRGLHLVRAGRRAGQLAARSRRSAGARAGAGALPPGAGAGDAEAPSTRRASRCASTTRSSRSRSASPPWSTTASVCWAAA
jgi:tRNA U34 2-thiouridine synthase MnmA/TrmU